MNTETVIKQLRKALECKDDKELRLRVEVITDMLEESKVVWSTYSSTPTQPVQPLFPRREPTLDDTTYNSGFTVSGSSSNKVKGSGAISSMGSEQINYRRPKGT